MRIAKIETQKPVYTFGTDLVIGYLERGVVPWRVPWTKAGMPQNLLTGKPYEDINLWLLAAADFPKNLFIDETQLKNSAWASKEVESTLHAFLFNGDVQKHKKSNNIKDEYSVSASFNVYNIVQCVNSSKVSIPEIGLQENNITLCENIVGNMPNRPRMFRLGPAGDDTYYQPLKDFISIPPMEEFDDKTSYYAALFHELVHSTGHESRLGRKELLDTTPFGSSYTLEELVADIGTSYLLSYTGIKLSSPTQNSLLGDGWLEKLYENEHLIFIASHLAQKAVDYILNKQDKKNSRGIFRRIK